MKSKDLRISLKLPGRETEGSINVMRSGKPPRLNFQPGQIFKVDQKTYRIMYVYRLATQQHEWQFCCEEILTDTTPELVPLAGTGETTPRVVYELFYSQNDVLQFFAGIPASGNRRTFSNQMLIRKGVTTEGRPLISTSQKDKGRKINR